MASPIFTTTSLVPSPPTNLKRKRNADDALDSFDASESYQLRSMELQPGRTMKRWRNGRPRDEEVYRAPHLST